MKSLKPYAVSLLLAFGHTLVLSAESIGVVTLVIGQAKALSADGSTTLIKRGADVFSGSAIETSAGGHVHVRFLDGALVSVRPASRLTVERYEASSGGVGAIKFKVEKGVVRSVTGEWGQANPEKFRLNTPVAAIGVKGTDFVVRVSGEATEAAVFAGAIAMSPLTPECERTLGPCEAANMLTLASDKKGLMLQLGPQTDGAPKLAPYIDLLAGRARDGQLGAGKTVVAESAAVERNSQTAAVADAVTQPRPLLWLHNRAGWNVPSQTISQRYTDALASGMRPVVGDLFVSLYRDETVHRQYQPIAANPVAFKLREASAVYHPGVATGRSSEVATISHGTLNVNFASSQYVTQLRVSAPHAGPTLVNVAGRIDGTGRFVGNNANTSIAGGLSHDGTEAGYMFNQAIGLGNLTGLTLWGQ